MLVPVSIAQTKILSIVLNSSSAPPPLLFPIILQTLPISIPSAQPQRRPLVVLLDSNNFLNDYPTSTAVYSPNFLMCKRDHVTKPTTQQLETLSGYQSLFRLKSKLLKKTYSFLVIQPLANSLPHPDFLLTCIPVFHPYHTTWSSLNSTSCLAFLNLHICSNFICSSSFNRYVVSMYYVSGYTVVKIDIIYIPV